MNCTKCGNCKGVCPFTFGLALGITSGLFMMFYAWAAWLWGWGNAIVDQYSSVYMGYEASLMGGVYGGLWGLLVGFVFGFLLIMFYHLLSCCKKMCCKKGNGNGSCGCCGSKECK
jgi:hypothetical protein